MNYDPRKTVGIADGYGRLLEITPVNLEFALANRSSLVSSYGAKGVSLKGFSRADVSFIEGFHDIEELRFTYCSDLDLSSLSKLTFLRRIALGDTGRKNIVDLSDMKHLESLLMVWGKGVSGLEGLHNLSWMRVRSLRLAELTAFNLPPNLQELQLINARIPNLLMLGNQQQIRKLRIAGISRNFVFDGLEKFTSLQHLSLESVRIGRESRFVEASASHRDLRGLYIESGGVIESLEWIVRHELLEAFSMFDTKLESGDVACLLELPALRDVDFDFGRKASHTAQFIREQLAIRPA